VTAWTWWGGRVVCSLGFLVCLHLSAFVCSVCGLSMWAAYNGCTVLRSYAPLEVARQGEVAMDLTFLTDFIVFFKC
jgi:hypothetical protein